MAKKTAKKVRASRKNGSKSNGPKTPEGKKAVRFNALKDGLFTKEIIIDSLGELEEDFERLQEEMWKFFEPMNPLEEMLVNDIVENRWRLQRVRRAEAIDLKKRLELISDSNLSPSDFSPSEIVQSLQAQFYSCYETYLSLLVPQSQSDSSSVSKRLVEILEIEGAFEDVRRELASSSSGVGFLLDVLERVRDQAKAYGYVSAERAIFILACCGFGDEIARVCYSMNRELQPPSTSTNNDAKSPKTGSQPPAASNTETSRTDPDLSGRKKENSSTAGTKDSNTGKEQGKVEEDDEFWNMSEEEQKRRMLVSGIEMCVTRLKARKLRLKRSESVNTEVRKAEALVDANSSDRFLRAETAFERRMYRALGMLVAIKQAQSLPPSIPGDTKQTEPLRRGAENRKSDSNPETI